MLSHYGRMFLSGLLQPVVVFIHTTGISPNLITIIGFILTCVVALVLSQGNFFWGGLLLTGAALFDLLDGNLARIANRKSRFGAFLDSTLDRYSEAVTLFGLLYYYSGQGAQQEVLLLYIAIVGSLLVSYTRARAEGLGVECKVAIAGRGERVVILIAGLITGLVLPILWILAILANVTALQRIWHVYRKTGGEQGG